MLNEFSKDRAERKAIQSDCRGLQTNFKTTWTLLVDYYTNESEVMANTEKENVLILENMSSAAFQHALFRNNTILAYFANK
ncbi:hypothetical protein TrispH2_002891, partial [Trichoplax sp. H2]